MVYKFPIAHWMYKRYPTTRVDKLLPRMRYEIPDRPIKVRGDKEWRRAMFGPQTRLLAIAKGVTELIRDERVDMSYYKAYEVRNYTERLIMEAIRHGDRHRPTMETANFYLNEKNLVYKLFKVLVPRYMNYSEAFTRMYLLPLNVKRTLNPHITQRKYGECKTDDDSTNLHEMAVLELKGNPYPSVHNEPIESKHFLTNSLLRAARLEYNIEKEREKKSVTEESFNNKLK